MSRHVRERFPDYSLQIRQLYEEDHEFRGLCHDYGVCVEELQKRETTAFGRDWKQLVDQFRELRADLEVEIAEYLNTNLTQSSG